MKCAPPGAGPVEPRELATVGQAHGPTPDNRLEDDRERPLHREFNDEPTHEEDPKNAYGLDWQLGFGWMLLVNAPGGVNETCPYCASPPNERPV